MENKQEPFVHQVGIRWVARCTQILRGFLQARRWRRTTIYIAGLSVLLLAAFFYWPRSVALAYAAPTCISAPTILPSLATTKASESYTLKPVASLSVGTVALFARSACIEAVQAPKENASERLSIAPPFLGWTQKRITVRANTFPALSAAIPTGKPISTKDTLKLELDAKDTLFTYTIIARDKKAPCAVRDRTVSCNVAAMNLAQATPYEIAVIRTLGGEGAGELVRQTLTTVNPVQIEHVSISAGAMLFDSPPGLTFQVNKPSIHRADIRLENRSTTPATSLPITTTLTGNGATVAFKEPLPRSAQLTLVVSTLESADGAFISAPFELPFSTSGGPKVKGINIGSSKVQPDTTLTLTFDSNIGPNQNLAEFVKVEAGTGATGVISAQGNRITIRTSGQGRCMPFTVKVLDGIKNEFGIAGGSAWQFSSRTLCQTTFGIGSSVQGRAITGYRFGNGPNKIVFIGGLHGDEKSSVYLLNRWIDQLEAHPSRIPAHQTIIIIPNTNPDGYAANRRVNANNVDLNRNFPSNNWKSGVTMPDKSFWPTGGGTAPLSEPESRAVASYITGQQPRLVLSYHASGSIVQPNGAGDSAPIGVEYANKSIVGYLSPGQTSFFDYDTTGAMEDWLADKYGRAALVIELSSRTSNDYSGHEKALWYIAGL